MKDIQKPYVVRFKIDNYILALMYLCYFNKIPLDLLMALYEKFGKHALFFMKALACKGYIRVTDKQFCKIIDDCTLLTKMIRNKEIKKDKFDDKMNKFIDYLETNSEDVYSYEVRFFFDLEDFYGAS